MTKAFQIGKVITGLSTGLYNNTLSGLRNKIINGNFDFWQRGTGQTSISGYGSDDRWGNFSVGSTKTVERLSFLAGQVPFDAKFYSRTTVVSVAGANNFVNKHQRIENVRTLAGKKATVTFWARGFSGATVMAIDLYQTFGSGGTPSSNIEGIGATKVNLTETWQKFSFVVDIPSIAGKTIGTNNDDCLALRFWFDAGSTYNTQTLSLGQRSGLFDLSHVSLVEGDATNESDPFSPRHLQQELALCERYYQRYTQGSTWLGVGTAYSAELRGRITMPLTTTMRTTPSATVSGGASYFNGGWIDTAMTFEGVRENMITFSFSVPSYGTPNASVPLWLVRMSNSNNTIWGYINLDAEL